MKPILRSVATAAVLAQMLAGAGCQHVERYIHNGFKIGPNYCPPTAPVKDQWIDAADRGLYQAKRKGRDCIVVG